MEFQEWLESELSNRGWTPSDLAHKAGTYPSTIARILNGERQPGSDICRAVAGALDIPPEKVFRKAGLLPEIPYGELDELNLAEMIDLMRNLSPKERRDVLEYTRLRYRLSREDRVAGKGGGK